MDFFWYLIVGQAIHALYTLGKTALLLRKMKVETRQMEAKHALILLYARLRSNRRDL